MKPTLSPARRRLRAAKQREELQLSRVSAFALRVVAPPPLPSCATRGRAAVDGLSTQAAAASEPSALQRLKTKVAAQRFHRMMQKMLYAKRFSEALATATPRAAVRDSAAAVSPDPVPVSRLPPPKLPTPVHFRAVMSPPCDLEPSDGPISAASSLAVTGSLSDPGTHDMPLLIEPSIPESAVDVSSFPERVEDEELPIGSLGILPAHVLLAILTAGFMAPRELECLRRTCKGLSQRHPSSMNGTALPCEAARMLLATHEHSKMLQRSAALQTQTSSRAAGAAYRSVSPAIDEPQPSSNDVEHLGGAFWLAKLNRVVTVPGAWKSLATALERRAYHRSQLVSWAQRFSELRHTRAVSNLASLVRRSAAASATLAARRAAERSPAPEEDVE